LVDTTAAQHRQLLPNSTKEKQHIKKWELNGVDIFKNSHSDPPAERQQLAVGSAASRLLKSSPRGATGSSR